MDNTRNGCSSVPNRSDSYDSGTRSSGWRVPALSSRNAWSRSDSIFNRRLLDDPPSVYSRTSISSTVDSHTRQQIPIRNSNNLRRQQLEALRQAVHNHPPARPESNSRSAASQATEEDEVLKHLTKETYNPVPKAKSLLLRNLSLYYRNKNPGTENSRSLRDYSDEEEEKRCTVCLEDFEPKEIMMITPCKHIFHEECIIPWLKTKGQCPVCRSVILKPTKRDSSPGISSNLAGEMTGNDLFTLDIISVVRAMEETFLFGYPRRL